MSRRTDEVSECELCQRQGPLTFHHLIPRSLHSNKWFKKNYTREEMQEGLHVCRDCHGAIHKFLDEKTLGRHYNSKKQLLQHAEIGNFVKWISGRSTGRVRSHRRRS